MARRTDVFQSKVLQRLYPATPNVEKEQSPPQTLEALANKTHVKRDAAKSQSAANTGRRLYTVLPPPADYNIHSEESVTLPQLESINSAEDPAAVAAHDGSDEPGEDIEAEGQQWRKRRRRKRKTGSRQDSEKHGEATVSESSRDQSQTAEDEGGERISKNKRRKLKKKRHKEKLLSMGLMPQAAALEFTYQKDEEEEEEEVEEEDSERRAAEVSDFLRKTVEIYMSDSSVHVDHVPHLSATVDDLLGGIVGGRKPHSVLKQLHRLKVFVQQSERDKLEKALKELDSSCSMTAEETAAVVSLFQYWITDILPKQGEEKTILSTTHP